VAAAWGRRGGGGSAAAAGDGRGKGKGDRWCDGVGDATATECAMVTQRRQKAGRLRRYRDRGEGDRVQV
jgi:hypothetical protein